MTKLNPGTREGFRAIQAIALEAMNKVLEAHGLRARGDDGTLGGPSESTFRFAISRTGAEGDAARKEEFARFAPMFGFKPEHYGAEITVGGRRFRMVGFDPGRPKNCVLIERLGDGRPMICPLWTAKAALGARL